MHWQLLVNILGKESVIYESQLPEGIDSVRHIQDMEDAIYRSAIWSMLFVGQLVIDAIYKSVF